MEGEVAAQAPVNQNSMAWSNVHVLRVGVFTAVTYSM